jgi:AcrR family transcriptional regulator
MARSFRDGEKKAIRERLLASGREMFERYGPKKTSIEELSASAGIGQGTFYLFFASKEDLFFEVLQQEELALRGRIGGLLSEGEPTRKGLKRAMSGSLDLLVKNPFIMRLLESGEYDRFVSRVREEKCASHLDEERGYIEGEIRRMQARGVAKRVKPEVLAGLLYGLFVLHLHRKQIGEAAFPQVMELLTDVICDALVARGGRNLETGNPSYLMEE